MDYVKTVLAAASAADNLATVLAGHQAHAAKLAASLREAAAVLAGADGDASAINQLMLENAQRLKSSGADVCNALGELGRVFVVAHETLTP